jgi:hypothetical protein
MNNLANKISECVSDVASLWNEETDANARSKAENKCFVYHEYDDTDVMVKDFFSF